MTQQGDIVIRHTRRGGDIYITGGVVDMDGGLAGAAYLSLFTAGGWWGGNYKGAMLQAIEDHPLTSAGRVAIERAAEADLAWLITTGAARSVGVTVRIEGPKRINVQVNIDGEDVGDWALNWAAPVDPPPEQPGALDGMAGTTALSFRPKQS